MARILPFIRDNLINFVTGLGTIKDPSTAAMHNLVLLDRGTLDITYRSNWLAKRIVNAPAEDATREWRTWQAANKQIEALEDAEKEFDLQRKVRQTLIRARLYGGAGLVLGVDQGNPEEELNIEKVKKGDLKFVVSVSMHDLMPGPVNWDVLSPFYSRPEYYTVASRIQNLDSLSTVVRIHPSRVVIFVGNEIPDPTISPMGPEWGDSVLVDCDEVIKDFGMVVGGLANMVNDAKMDVIKIPDFSKNIATSEYANRLLTRFSFANQSKSSINSLLLDSEEEWNRISTSFSGLPQLLHEFLTVTSGAAGIPVSRLMGQAPGKALGNGTSGGEQDMRNYYDTITSMQNTMIGPVLEPLDNILMAHALGKVDPVIFYEWSPLYTPDPAQLADIAVKKAQVAQADVTMALINPDALRRARINQLVEDGTYPGLEDAVEEFGEEPPEPPADPAYDPNAPKKPDPKGGGFGGGGGGGGNTLNITHSIATDFNPNHEPEGTPGGKGGQFAAGPEGGSKRWREDKTDKHSAVVMVSPNTARNLPIDKAQKLLNSLREQKFMEASSQIDASMGLTSTVTPVLGAWEHGAEPSIMIEYPKSDEHAIEIASAMKGYVAEQKSALIFHRDPKGTHFLLSFPAKGTLEDISAKMVEDGIAYHTLVPTVNKTGRISGATVVSWAQSKEDIANAARGADRYGAKIDYVRGAGHLIGTEQETGTDEEQRAAAGREYAAIIGGDRSDRVQELWGKLGSPDGKNLVKFAPLSAAEHGLSVIDILDPKTPAIPARSRSVVTIANELNDRGQKQIKAAGFTSGKITESTPEGDEMLARVIAGEVIAAIDRGDKTASSKGWYSDKVSKAMRLAALTHPELSQDVNAAFAYKLAMAVTSQQERVPRNVDLTEQVYEYFKAHGKFPTNVKSKEQKSMNSNFRKLNALMEAHGGMDGVRAFLSQEYTVGQLKAMGYKLLGENVDEKVYGSAILGPKIGQGFFQNLTGNYDPMTFDLWWMRSWGRITGTLVDTVKPEGLKKQEATLAKELKAAGKKVPKDKDALLAVAKEINDIHETDYQKNNADYKSGEKVKSKLTLAASRYILGRAGVRAQPGSGTERAWMRSVGAKALELLKARGISMTPADLQATWWYPEKTLYNKLGGRSEGDNINYAEAMAKLARERGHSEADIQRILNS